MSHLSLRGVTKRFGATTAVDRVSLAVEESETVVLLGPSGCGKTTCLRLIAGFERPSDGTIELGGRQLASSTTFVPPEKRHMSVVFQTYALWPHMSVYDNVAFGPSLEGRSGQGNVDRRVKDTLDLVQLAGLADRFPHQLSGGQQQRVALARALVTQPSTLLLDEPLSNLDTRLREEMRFEIKRIQKLLGVTMVYVTHDQAEALSLADRLIVMREGRIEQAGPPEQIYRRPRNEYVAAALGATNLVPGTVVSSNGNGSRIVGPGGLEVVTEGHDLRRDESILLSIRPADIELGAVGADDGAGRARITESLFFGDAVQYAVEVDGFGQPLKVTGSATERHEVGSLVSLTVEPGVAAVLEADPPEATTYPMGEG